MRNYRLPSPRSTALLLLLLLGGSSAGCTWVPLTPAGGAVGVAAPETNLDGCERVGAVTAQTKARVGFITRGEEKVIEELRTLARNDAAEMGAQLVVPEGPPSAEGRQRFAAYRCSR
ncbi:MAG: DUF4156 domain-containing protein [Myxococcota bacterium]